MCTAVGHNENEKRRSSKQDLLIDAFHKLFPCMCHVSLISIVRCADILVALLELLTCVFEVFRKNLARERERESFEMRQFDVCISSEK